jgi:predicted small lipoprotein YifL
MTKTLSRIRQGAAVLALLALVACGDEKKPLPPGDQVPDFSLIDVNPNSVTHDVPVSPRDHLGHVSAWYFGHAT